MKNNEGYEIRKSMLKWTVEFYVDLSWVADGFNLTEERAHSMIANTLQYAHNREVGARVIVSPDAEKIAKLQGYESAEKMNAAR